MGTNLGGLNNGQLPKGGLIGIMNGDNERSMIRATLRRVPNALPTNLEPTKLERGTTFRQVENVFNKEPVKDSSVYIKFKKQGAINQNYNDSSFGGSNNGSFTFLNRVRS